MSVTISGRDDVIMVASWSVLVPGGGARW